MSPPKKKRALWSEDSLSAAMAAVQRGQLSTYQAAARYSVPRRTLRNHLTSGKITKELGRKSTLTKDQEDDFVKRIIKFAQIAIPLTPKVIRRQAFVFCEKYNIPNNFNKEKRLAGRDWLALFLKRNPTLTKRKAQFLNPARAQKLNKVIVSEHFKEVEKLYDELQLHDHPERIYNMDEKGCRLTVHNQAIVIAQRGAKRVHMQASEHAENVTIVGCVNALGNSIPPMILFKGKRKKPEFDDHLPTGSIVRMAQKGSMTTELFVDFIKHLGNYKIAGKCLLIFDGAKCHLDFSIVEEAEKYDIVLYCLPSNTTHELQPLDKACYRPFEHYWDQEVVQYLYEHRDKKLTKARFNIILSKVWSKCMTHENITSGFRATGLYPLNANAIPEIAFAPSVLTEIQQLASPSAETRQISPIASTSQLQVQQLASPSEETHRISPIASTSQVQVTRRPVIYNTSSDSSDAESLDEFIQRSFVKRSGRIYSSSSDYKDDNVENAIPVRSSQEQICPPDKDGKVSLINLNQNPQFKEVMPTPDYSVIKYKPRRKALNYKGQRVTKDLFKNNATQRQMKQSNQKKAKNKNRNNEGISKEKKQGDKESKKKKRENLGKSQDSWYCHGCGQDRVADMRPCAQCLKYYHEECVGLTKNDKDKFVCPNGCD